MSDKYYARDRILDLLEKSSPKSMREIEAEIGISYQRVRTAIQEMRVLDRQRLHITEWRPVDACHMIAFFSFGPGKDAPKPPKTPRVILNQRSRQRMKARKIEREAAEAKKKVGKELQRMAFRHPQDIAFFGPPPIICSTAFCGNVHVQPMEVEDELETA